MAGRQIILEEIPEKRFPRHGECYAQGNEIHVAYGPNESFWVGTLEDYRPLRVVRNDFDQRHQAEKTLARINEILNAGSERRDRAGKDLDKAAHYQQVVTEIAAELMAAEGLPVKQEQSAGPSMTLEDSRPDYHVRLLSPDSPLYHHGMRAVVFPQGHAPIAACFSVDDASTIRTAMNQVGVA